MTGNMEPTAPGGVETPNSTSSLGSGATSAIDVAALAERIEALERAGQSVKDKRIAEMQGQIKDFGSQLARFNKLVNGGMSQDAAMSFMQMEEALASKTPQPNNEPQAAPIPATGNRTGKAPIVDTSLALLALGLSDTDPEVTQLVQNGSVDLAALVNLAARRKQAEAAPPNPAAIAPTGGAPGGGESIESVTAELNRLSANPGKNMKAIRETQERLNQLLKQ